MGNNKISIIIPCYNQARYLSETINSVKEQSYTNWECIIINNGSSDDTDKIVKDLIENNPRFKYIEQENKGVSDARNKGFEISQGNFIQFLDGDDFLVPEKIEKQLDFLLKNEEYGVCYSDINHYYEKTGKSSFFEHQPVEEYPLNDILNRWDKNIGLTIHSALLRRDIWKENERPFTPEYKDRYEDWIFWTNVALKNVRFKYLPFLSAYYRIHDQNFVSDPKDAIINYTKAIHFIQQMIPHEHKKTFYEINMERAMEKYAQIKIQKEIYNSFTWKLAKRITKPILFIIPERLKQKMKFKQ